MSIQYELEQEKNVLRIRINGFVATKDVIAHLNDVLNNNLVSPGQVAIVDVEAVDVFINTQSDFAEIENLVSQLFARGRVCNLFVVADSRNRKMIEQLVQSFQKGSIEVMICHSKQHAEETLNAIRKNQQINGE